MDSVILSEDTIKKAIDVGAKSCRQRIENNYLRLLSIIYLSFVNHLHFGKRDTPLPIQPF